MTTPEHSVSLTATGAAAYVSAVESGTTPPKPPGALDLRGSSALLAECHERLAVLDRDARILESRRAVLLDRLRLVQQLLDATAKRTKENLDAT